jgi:hypothetical protein
MTSPSWCSNTGSPTEDSLYDIALFPLGDGVVNTEDLMVLAEHMSVYEQSIDVNDH